MTSFLPPHDPDVILSIGQAGGRTGITVERVGINCDDYGIADNDGNKVIDLPVFEDGMRKEVDGVNDGLFTK